MRQAPSHPTAFFIPNFPCEFIYFTDGELGSERLNNSFKVSQLVNAGALEILIV